MIWHSASSQQVLQELETNQYKGLTHAQASARLRRYGVNKLHDQKRRSFLQLFWTQFKSPTVLIVLAAAAVWLITGVLLQSTAGLFSAVAVAVICLLGALLGAVKEHSAEAGLDRLRVRAQSSARVLRAEQVMILPAAGLVPGDIVYLQAGDYVPADARLIQSDLLRCDESSLTGEPVSVAKDAAATLADITQLKDRANMVFSGCTVTDGTGVAVVTATGMATEKAKIASVVQDALRIQVPLQQRWRPAAHNLLLVAGAVGILLFILGMILTPGSLIDRLAATVMTCASLAAAAAPEAVAGAITVVLAVGMLRMARHHLLVRTLPTVETLGRVSVICADKTGTLTQNRMTVTALFDGQESLALREDTALSKRQKDLLLMAAMCCDADVIDRDGQEQWIGDHTEAGIVAAARRYGDTDKQTVDSLYPRLSLVPFDAERQLKTSVNMIDGHPVAVVKGAPDRVLALCAGADEQTVSQAARVMAEGALRVIGIAYKPLAEAPADPTAEELEHDLIFCGLLGLADPPAADVIRAVATARRAGIRVVMMTGDQEATAAAAARELGIGDGTTRLMTGDELDGLSDEELAQQVETVAVCVRMNAQQKQRFIAALQSHGHVVAATGGSVTDAQMLRTADVGCAIGTAGSDVARGAAEVTVTDDRFTTILGGIEAGRSLYENIRHTVCYAVGCFAALALTFLVGLLVFGQMPYDGPRLLWQNLVWTLLPALALGVERPAPGLMTRPGRPLEQGLFDRRSFVVALVQGALLAAAALVAYRVGLQTNAATAGTMAYLVLGSGAALSAFALRSTEPLVFIFSRRFNYWLLAAVPLCVILLLPVCQWSLLANMLGAAPLPHSLVGTAVLLAFAPVVVLEVIKLILRLVGKKA